MGRFGFKPNEYTISTLVSAFSGTKFNVLVPQIHALVVCSGLNMSISVVPTLMKWYAKMGNVEALGRVFNEILIKDVACWNALVSGGVEAICFDAKMCNIDAAFSIFKSMQNKNLVSWNSLIAGYARQGLGTRALQEFNRMLSNGVTPNQVTIFNVLLACRGSGLVEEGERHFNSMNHKYGIQPGLEHYACMMETYGKAGHMGKAETLIKEMLSKFDVVLWGAFLRAFYLYSGLEPPEFATEFFKIEKGLSCSLFSV
ncbi:AMP-dependent synthetase and ligase family protein isoform 1 [Hibiscus syriacus]|uniref:AMP-dependent synthetase and ligase family protein isoform 1 n=1 Tax=Hibiscus syriacus TaxID=106335 RepID=A0A6A2X7L1_HIBSY|nr:AMP-dependent synthetase and ligase family protein isoform 1 [Hibiscus syriacus]